MFSFPREDKQKYSSLDTLDSIGGGHLLGILDSEAGTTIFRSLLSSLENRVTIKNKTILVMEYFLATYLQFYNVEKKKIAIKWQLEKCFLKRYVPKEIFSFIG